MEHIHVHAIIHMHTIPNNLWTEREQIITSDN